MGSLQSRGSASMKNSAHRNKPTQQEFSSIPPPHFFNSLVHNQRTLVFLVLVLFLGALSLFPVAPAQAQAPVWSATLTDNSIEVGGSTYSVGSIKFYVSGALSGYLRILFGQATIGNDLKALNFCVGSTAFALSGISASTVSVPNTNLGISQDK